MNKDNKPESEALPHNGTLPRRTKRASTEEEIRRLVESPNLQPPKQA
jgi:hypothetical protein